MKKFIVIPHVLPPKRWEVKSLEAAAIDDGLEIEHFNSREELVASFDGCETDIPESYLKAVEHTEFPCVHVYDNGSINYWERAEKFDAEQVALDFYLGEYNAVIAIESIEDARYYASQYDGHQWVKVRALAREIMEEMR